MSKRYELAKKYTEKYKGVLLPCRTCGNKNIVISSERTIFPPKNGWSVNCMTKNCDCTGIYTSVREAIKKWNDNQLKGIE